MLMALFRVVLGPCAQYFVVPLLAGLTVWLAFLLGRRLTGRASIGVSAALVLSTSNPFVFSLLWPMSDVPASAAWTLALVLALPGTSLAGLLAGLASSAAVLIRPNLVPLGLVIGVALLSRAVRDRRVSARALKPALAFACGMLPGVAAVALVNHHLYGSPFLSGYGSPGELYALGGLGRNARNYLGWILDSGSAYVLLGMLAILGPWPRTVAPPASHVPLRVLFGGFIVVMWLSYLFYSPFDAWWYLRFLLPVWPLALDLLKRLRLPGAEALVVILAFGLFLHGQRGVVGGGMPGLRQLENRYAAAGDHVRRTTEPDAIVLAMQHSGSVRYYGGRQSVRYDLLDPAWLDRGAQSLAARGYHVLALLEDWEEPLFRKRFASGNRLGRLDWRPVAEVSPGVRLYDLTQPESGRFTRAGFLRYPACSGVATDGGTVPRK
jgi:hypothetical protein